MTGHITPRVSWPRPATPTALTPAWAGEFRDFGDWVSFATQRLTGTHDPLMGAEVTAICIDAVGRRCTMGGHFMRARDEGAFPVRFFWDCTLPQAPAPRPAANVADRFHDLHVFATWKDADEWMKPEPRRRDPRCRPVSLRALPHAVIGLEARFVFMHTDLATPAAMAQLRARIRHPEGRVMRADGSALT